MLHIPHISAPAGRHSAPSTGVMWRVLLLATLAAIRADEATFEDFGALARQELSSDEVPFGEDVAITVGEGQWWHGHVR
eukprot:1839697-Prymnesium_polylepis.1